MPDDTERILVIDDDATLLRVCAEMLHGRGYEVVAVQSGEEALRLLTQQPFALALVDIVLPDISGLTILKTIRRTDPDVVVLLMTGFASLDTAVEALRDGAYDYLRKPFESENLIRVVQRGLEQRRAAIASRRHVEELDSANRELTAQVDRATDELTAFVELGEQQGAGETPTHMLEHVLSAAAQLTHAEDCGLFLRQADGRIICVLGDGPRAAELRAADLTDHALLTEALQSDQPVVRARLLDDPTTATGPLALAGFSSAMIVPLPGSTAAVVLVDPDQEFTAREASLVRVMARQVAGLLAAGGTPGRGSQLPRGPDEFVDLVDLLGWST